MIFQIKLIRQKKLIRKNFQLKNYTKNGKKKSSFYKTIATDDGSEIPKLPLARLSAQMTSHSFVLCNPILFSIFNQFPLN